MKAFGTGEWAKHSFNIVSGCAHDCRYCYAKSMAVRFGRKTVETWKDETVDVEKVSRRFTRKRGRIMFPTSHDITPGNLDHCMAALGNMLAAGNEVLVVSKPHLECIEAICGNFNRYRGNILFRFTIGSAHNHVLKFWDQNAPSFDERVESLKHAFHAGFKTSVSCEPLLDDDDDALVKALLPYVTDAIWFGIGNDMTRRLKLNGRGDHDTLQSWKRLEAIQGNGFITALHGRHRGNPQIKWKDSIKKILGIERPEEKGLDI